MKYHKADWHWKFDPLRFSAWRCHQDGGWAIGALGFGIARLHRDDLIEWRVGPFVKRMAGETMWYKIVFIPAHMRIFTEAQRRYLETRR